MWTSLQGRGDDGSHEDCGKAVVMEAGVCVQSSREAACQRRVQEAASPCWSDGLQVFLTCSVYGSCYSYCHLISRISASPSLPSIPAAFLTLSATPVLLVRSPARPDCRNWLTWSLMLSGANDFFLLGHAYLSSGELMGWKDSYACVMCYQNNNSKVSV